jgi:hypothetical protein
VADALRRRPRWAAVVLLAIGCAIGAGALRAVTSAGGDSKAARSSACASDVRRGVLPEWARAGFSEAEPRIPHVLGASHRIVAILFGDPLTSPPRRGPSNKILWAAREPLDAPSDLRIRAQRMDGRRALGRPVSRVVARGPGPSIIDLPAPGCWRLTLRWAGRTDTLDLRYASADELRH